MKYIKTYEKINNIEKGDWVYCEINDDTYKPSEFVGKCINITSRKSYPYIIYYENGTILDDKNRRVAESEIKASSKNKKDLLIYINKIKYNL